MSNSNTKKIKDLRDICDDLIYVEEKIDKVIPGTNIEIFSSEHINYVIRMLKGLANDLEAADSHRSED